MIAHIDADAFFASALQRRQPKLRGKPVLATGMGGGCVIAASYEAKACGVRTGMRLTEAKKLCPAGIAVPSDFNEALVASREIEDIIKTACPDIERYSVDEWFLNLRHIFNFAKTDFVQWAEDMKQTVQRKTHLTVSVGIGPSKLLAKMASEYRKPAGHLVLPAMMSSDDFLRDRVVAAIPGIGSRREVHTQRYRWLTAYDFAYADSETVRQLMGRPGCEMQQELRGESVWPVTMETKPPKSISRCRSFPRTNDSRLWQSYLLDHLTYTILKMRRHGLACNTVYVWLRDQEYKSVGKDTKLPQPSTNQEQVLPYIQHCFQRAARDIKQCTQAGLALTGLQPEPRLQYSLFDDPLELQRREQRQTALDAIHDRYGRDALTRGSALATKARRLKSLHVANDASAW